MAKEGPHTYKVKEKGTGQILRRNRIDLRLDGAITERTRTTDKERNCEEEYKDEGSNRHKQEREN